MEHAIDSTNTNHDTYLNDTPDDGTGSESLEADTSSHELVSSGAIEGGME